MIGRVLLGIMTAISLCEGVAVAQSTSANELTTIAYPVADLVVPIATVRPEVFKTTEAELMTRILKNVAPTTWDRAGGPGSMWFESKGHLLHVRQTAAVHAELKSFLAKVQRGQVSLELRIMQLSGKLVESLDGFKWCDKWDERQEIGYATLSDIQVFMFLEAAQGDQKTHIMQAPKMTLFDGQTAKMEVGDWTSFKTGVDFQTVDGKPVMLPKSEKFFQGIQARFLPTLSADRKHVSIQAEFLIGNQIGETALMPMSAPVSGRLNDGGKPAAKDVVNFWVEKPAFSEIKLAVAAKIPDQRSVAIVAGKTLVEKRVEYRQPVLSRIPYLSRLFRNQAFGRETATVVVLLTPRIIAEPETAHVELLRNGIQAQEDGQFPLILSEGNK